MHKSVYSLVLSDQLVAQVDRAAYRSGLSRSAMVNQLLAQSLSYVTPEQQMEEIFSQVERLLAGEIFQPLAQPDHTMISLRSALAYKYNPSLRYSLVLFPSAPARGELRVSLRSQSAPLLLCLSQFFRLWDQLEAILAGGAEAAIRDGRYVRRLQLPEGLSPAQQGAVLAGYLQAMERGLDGFFRHLDRPQQAAALTEQVYRDYLAHHPAI